MQSSHLRSHGFFILPLPHIYSLLLGKHHFLSCWRTHPLGPCETLFIKGSQNRPKAPHLILQKLCRKEPNSMQRIAPSHYPNEWPYRLSSTTKSKDQYSPFYKDFECFVSVLVHVSGFCSLSSSWTLASLLLVCVCIL